MSILDRIPKNTDSLQSSKYILTFSRLKTTQYFCQSINIPGIAIDGISSPTPFSDLYIPGDKISYDPLDIIFIVDEDLLSWREIHDWIRGMAFPDNFTEYQNLNRLSSIVSQSKQPQYSDATLTSLTALNNPKYRVLFNNVFPTSLSSIDFNTQQSADNIITARASFRFTNYKIEKM